MSPMSDLGPTGAWSDDASNRFDWPRLHSEWPGLRERVEHRRRERRVVETEGVRGVSLALGDRLAPRPHLRLVLRGGVVRTHFARAVDDRGPHPRAVEEAADGSADRRILHVAQRGGVAQQSPQLTRRGQASAVRAVVVEERVRADRLPHLRDGGACDEHGSEQDPRE